MSDEESRSRSPSRSPSAENRSPSRSYSRSPSPSRSRHRDSYRSRSRSPYDDYRDEGRRGGRRRSRSRSPFSRRKRHLGDRERPTTSRCLGVFGLSLRTEDKEIRDAFSKYGPIEKVTVVYDHQTGRSRGFAFVYFENEDDAIEAKDRLTGHELDGRNIRVDFSITDRAHTPTPGIYLGRPTTRPGRGSRYSGGSERYGGGDRYGDRYSSDRYGDRYGSDRYGDRYDRYGDRYGGDRYGDRYGGGGYGGRYRERSPSPYYSRRYSRSRSRSYSPRERRV